jgi:hypothetical protein
MSFKDTQEYKKIIDLLKVENVINEWTFFQCYSDNIFTYHVKDTEKTHEFNFICEDILFREMLVTELLSIENLKYFEYCICEEEKKLIEISWSINN